MTLWLFTKLKSSIPLLYLDSPFNLAPFKSLINFKEFLRSRNGKSDVVSHLAYKFDKQLARCSNCHIKILNLFEFPHVSTAANDVLAETKRFSGIEKGVELSKLRN